MGSPRWARIRVTGTGSVRNAMRMRAVPQDGQIRGKTVDSGQKGGPLGGASGAIGWGE